MAEVTGLTSEEAAALAREGKANVVPSKASLTVKDIIARNVFTYFNAIFAALAVLVVIAGSYKSLTFLPVIIANTVIGIVQQLRAKKVLDELALLDVSDYTAIRDGADVRVASDALVLGDLVRLESGQQIPADAVVVSGEAGVNESLLTGEADEIQKAEGDELMSGSFVVAGSLVARLTRVGADSYASQLTAQAKQVKERPSEMVADIERIILVAGILVIPVGGLLYWQGMSAGRTVSEAIMSMVGAVIGMIPEGLYLLVTVALALSAMRLAKNKVLLHDMRSIEELARIDVLCVDKTGTITGDDMQVRETFDAKGAAIEPSDDALSLLARYVRTVPDSNATMLAMRDHLPEAEPFADADMTPFSSKLKYSQIVADGRTLRLGAPEVMLSDETLQICREALNARAGVGVRVLVFAEERDGEARPLLFVVMTGDGVNDILAMKKAECSIAMGTGSDAARQAAQVVLLDSDFSHMRQIVSEGRRDINNITRSATLFLYKNIFSLSMALFAVFGAFVYPLTPNQVSLISLFNIGLPAFLLTFEPNEKKQEGSFIATVLIRSIPAALTSFVGIAGMVLFAEMFGIAGEEVGTASTYLLSVVGFLILVNLIQPPNKYRVGVFVICVIGLVACCGVLWQLFDITALAPHSIVLCTVFALAEVGVLQMLTVAIAWIYRQVVGRK